MLLWSLLAAIAGAAALWIIRPLMIETLLPLPEGTARAQGYRAAMLALEAERVTQAIDVPAAETQRAVLARALIAETETSALPPSRDRPRWLSVLVIGALPAVAVVFYLTTATTQGTPSAMAYSEQKKLESITRELSRRVAENPNDPQGYRLLALADSALGQYQAAAQAYEKFLALGPRNAETLTRYGEMLALSAGHPTAAALAAFDEALSLDPHDLRARLERAEARISLGDLAGALEDWHRLRAAVPAESPAAKVLDARIAAATKMQASPLGSSEAQAIKSPAPQDQQAMIERMVEGLAHRLEAAPQDLAGWRRLIHSYVVLEDKDNARTALARAREVFAGDKSAQAELDAAAAEIR